jgi:hypothetical protein
MGIVGLCSTAAQYSTDAVESATRSLLLRSRTISLPTTMPCPHSALDVLPNCPTHPFGTAPIAHTHAARRSEGASRLTVSSVGRRKALLQRTFADSLYRRLTPYSITSAPSIASLIASTVLPVHIDRRTQTTAADHTVKETQSAARRHMIITFHIRQIKPRDVAASDQRLVDSHDRGLHIPLVCTAVPCSDE